MGLLFRRGLVLLLFQMESTLVMLLFMCLKMQMEFKFMINGLDTPFQQGPLDGMALEYPIMETVFMLLIN